MSGRATVTEAGSEADESASNQQGDGPNCVASLTRRATAERHRCCACTDEAGNKRDAPARQRAFSAVDERTNCRGKHSVQSDPKSVSSLQGTHKAQTSLPIPQ